MYEDNYSFTTISVPTSPPVKIINSPPEFYNYISYLLLSSNHKSFSALGLQYIGLSLVAVLFVYQLTAIFFGGLFGELLENPAEIDDIAVTASPSDLIQGKMVILQ